MTLTSEAVKSHAAAHGFDLCGIAPAAAFPALARFAEWIARGYAGDMHYLARSAARRADVREVLPSARSVIVLGSVYNVDRPYSTEIADPDEALIARYAWGDDYHEVIGRRLGALLDRLREASDDAFEAKAYVDTGPVQERAWAERAGLGWVGKNACLINPALGSWVVLAEVICSLALEPDAPGVGQCGTCTLCLDACPTGALVAPGVLDARRCLSYLTIEAKGPVPGEWRRVVGSHVFGCDVCQEVCPFNQAPARSADPAWQPRPVFDRPSIAALASLSDAELRAALRGSAMKRARLTGWRRNLEVCLENARRPDDRRVV